jgi:hypothetical protein
MGPRGLVIFLVLWLSLVLAILVIANLGHETPGSDLSFDVGAANADRPPPP